jgi:hypothetical protein
MQRWSYKTTWPLADILNDTFFLPVRGILRAGDEIKLCRFDGVDPNMRGIRLLETAMVTVVQSGADDKSVPLQIDRDIRKIPGPDGREFVAATLEPGEEGKWRIVAGDDLIEEFGSRKEAEKAMKALAA